jgi:hypothetical protein
MRGTMDLVAILDAVTAATPPLPPILPFEQRGLFYIPDPETRRAWRLATRGRLQTLSGLACFLADSADIPEWVARMALNAVVPVDHEEELDGPINHLPILERAAMAMGIDPVCVSRSNRMHS